MYSASVENGAFGGREEGDTICADNKPDGMTVATIKAFISVSEDDEIRDLPNNQAAPLPTNRILSGFPYAAEKVIANNWGSLFGDGPSVTFFDAGISEKLWFSGSYSDGSLIPDRNCIGWTTTYVGKIPETTSFGNPNETNELWIDGEDSQCAMSGKVIICIAWN